MIYPSKGGVERPSEVEALGPSDDCILRDIYLPTSAGLCLQLTLARLLSTLQTYVSYNQVDEMILYCGGMFGLDALGIRSNRQNSSR